MLANLLLSELDLRKKLLLKVNLHSFFKCNNFFHLLAYSCSEVIILSLFVVNLLPPYFLMDLFNENLNLFRILVILRGSSVSFWDIVFS